MKSLTRLTTDFNTLFIKISKETVEKYSLSFRPTSLAAMREGKIFYYDKISLPTMCVWIDMIFQNISEVFKNIFFHFNQTVIVVFILFLSSFSFAQIDHETRAVWLATNHRLDWPPPTFNLEKQKQDLEKIFENIKSKNLNTVYFQARFNGTVLFKSSFDPFSSLITGQMNYGNSYDPLQLAIEIAHKKGLEIHAWINAVNVFSGSDINTFNNPDHIAQRKPSWIVEDFRDGVKSYWLDPGLPEVREYLSDMIQEMVKNYDVDGVQLDYIRYPGKNFSDDFSYSAYGGGLLRDDWRRKNINDLVGMINEKIKSVKPHVKLGAAPIGVYKNQKGMYAWEGYYEVYQDSREWLRKGLLDYVAPQIYWAMDDNPRFDIVAKEWNDNSSGRSVVLGIGAYKENVKGQLEQLISYSREIKADGVAFFRYANIKDYTFENFGHKTYPALMAWLEGINPKAPNDLRFSKSQDNPNLILLDWKNGKKNQSDSIRYYSLYSLPNPYADLSPEYLFDVFPSDKTSVKLAIKPKKLNYFFTLKSVSKLWNESHASSNVVEIEFDQLKKLSDTDPNEFKPMLIKEINGDARILINSKNADEIKVVGKSIAVEEILLKESIDPGKNIIGIKTDISKYQSIKIIFHSTNRVVELKL